MSTDRDVDRIVRSWLDEGVTTLPDRVLDNVLDQVPATPQRRAWWPARRFRDMNTNARYLSAVAAVAVVAVIGVLALPRLGDIGGPSSTPTPSPTPSPSPTPTPTASPSPSPTGGPGAVHDGPLAPATYTIGPAGPESFMACAAPTGCTNTVAVELTVPDGWSGVGNDSIWLTDGGNEPPAGAGLLFVRGADLYVDPCGAEPGTIKVGPKVEDFAEALAAHPVLDVTTPVDVTLAGHSGRYVDLQVPSDLAACSVYRPWEPGLFAQGPSQRWHLWILDVAGERLVVQSTDYTGTTAENQASLQAIVDSIKITN